MARRNNVAFDHQTLSLWLTLQQAAQAGRLDPSAIARNLSELRSGKDEASARLQQGLMYLVYEVGFAWVEKGKRRRLEDVIGALTDGLFEAIKRLADNEVTDAEKHVRDELLRTLKDVGREDSSNLYPPSSTNSDRKGRGLEPYTPIKRQGTCASYDALQETSEASVCESPVASSPLVRDEDGEYYTPSRFSNQNDDIELIDLLDEFQTAGIRSTAELAIAGHTTADICRVTGVTTYAARQYRDGVNRQLRASGIAPPEAIDMALAQPQPTQPVPDVTLAARGAELAPQGLEVFTSA